MIYCQDRKQQSHVGTCSRGIKIEKKDRVSGAFQAMLGTLFWAAGKVENLQSQHYTEYCFQCSKYQLKEASNVILRFIQSKLNQIISGHEDLIVHFLNIRLYFLWH